MAGQSIGDWIREQPPYRETDVTAQMPPLTMRPPVFMPPPLDPYFQMMTRLSPPLVNQVAPAHFDSASAMPSSRLSEAQLEAVNAGMTQRMQSTPTFGFGFPYPAGGVAGGLPAWSAAPPGTTLPQQQGADTAYAGGAAAADRALTLPSMPVPAAVPPGFVSRQAQFAPGSAPAPVAPPAPAVPYRAAIGTPRQSWYQPQQGVAPPEPPPASLPPGFVPRYDTNAHGTTEPNLAYGPGNGWNTGIAAMPGTAAGQPLDTTTMERALTAPEWSPPGAGANAAAPVAPVAPAAAAPVAPVAPQTDLSGWIAAPGQSANSQWERYDDAGNVTASGRGPFAQSQPDATLFDPFGLSAAAAGGGAGAGAAMPVAAGGARGPLNGYNPGNLRPVGASTGFRQFNSLAEGYAALDQDLAAKGREGLNTVEKIISKYAPPKDETGKVINDTPAYIRDVATRLGVQPGDTLNMTDPAVRARFAQAVATHEHGANALALATGSPGTPGAAPVAQSAGAAGAPGGASDARAAIALGGLQNLAYGRRAVQSALQMANQVPYENRGLFFTHALSAMGVPNFPSVQEQGVSGQAMAGAQRYGHELRLEEVEKQTEVQRHVQDTTPHPISTYKLLGPGGIPFSEQTVFATVKPNPNMGLVAAPGNPVVPSWASFLARFMEVYPDAGPDELAQARAMYKKQYGGTQ